MASFDIVRGRYNLTLIPLTVDRSRSKTPEFDEKGFYRILQILGSDKEEIVLDILLSAVDRRNEYIFLISFFEHSINTY